jgi:hypothetical protein
MYNHKEYQKQWRETHKEYKKTWFQKHKEKYKKKYKESQKNSFLVKNYGISIEQYNELFLKQNGCCKICGRHQSEFKRSLAVDHCHDTKKIRGLLCHHCNQGIGAFFEDILIMERAINYIKESSN